MNTTTPLDRRINETLIKTLPVGHMIRTMSLEHQKILEYLDTLDHLREVLNSLKTVDENPNIIGEITQIAEYLIGSEPHHQREEQVLFPVLENHGITGPPEAMRSEHNILRKLKHNLLDTASEHETMKFEEFQSKVDSFAKDLVLLLRQHIYKEEFILYPMALNTIKEKSAWDTMKTDCDKIGYCNFTPVESE